MRRHLYIYMLKLSISTGSSDLVRSTIFCVSDKGEPSNWRHGWGQPSFECPRNLSPARMLFHHTTDTLLPINCDSMEGVFGQKWKTVGPGDVHIFPLPIGGFSGVVAIEAKTHISTSWIRHSLKTLRGVKRPEIRRCDTKKRFSGRILYTNPQVDEFYWDVFFFLLSRLNREMPQTTRFFCHESDEH